MPDVDVVIATRNRHAPLHACLEALARQSFRDFGVIIVDDASDEPVATHLPDDLRRALSPVIVRQERQRGPGAARNTGVAASGASRVVFVDDDVRAHPDLVARHAAALAACDGKAGRAVIGPLAMPPDWRPTAWNLWEARTVDVEYGRMLRGEYLPTWRQFHTGNASLCRADFDAVGGFDERFDRAEDIELALRLHQRGCTFVFDPLAIGWHYAYRPLGAWLHVARAYARTDVMLDRLHPEVGWLRTIKRERARRHPLLRAARRLCDHTGLRPLVTMAATQSARPLHAAGASRLAMQGLSLAYDLQYSATLRREEGAARPLPDGAPPRAVAPERSRVDA